MFTIFRTTVRERRTSILAFTLGGMGLILLYVGLYPTIQSQISVMNSLLAAYPQGVLKAFNFSMDAFNTLEGYLSTENFGLIWPIMLMFLGVSLGAGAIAGEIDKGSMGLILAQPISRTKIFWEKYLAGVYVIGVFTILTVMSTPVFAKMFNLSFHFGRFAMLSVYGLLLGLSILSLSTLLSVMFSDKGRVNGIMAGVLVVMYVLKIVSGLKDSLINLKYGSFFYYFNSTDILQKGIYDHWSYLVFGLVIVITTGLALFIFQKRDISI